MVAIPTIENEDAKRPNRERECLVGEKNRIINRMKATLTRLGIRGFNPKLKKAAERLDALRTPEGEPIPPNTLAEMRRQLINEQIRQIDDAPARYAGLTGSPAESGARRRSSVHDPTGVALSDVLEGVRWRVGVASELNIREAIVRQ
jgi:transposase